MPPTILSNMWMTRLSERHFKCEVKKGGKRNGKGLCLENLEITFYPSKL